MNWSEIMQGTDATIPAKIFHLHISAIKNRIRKGLVNRGHRDTLQLHMTCFQAEISHM